ncbi:unnamed protein product [Nezara viridula]|uniref:Uncharacterized protein n=1 Tax=Nezara viridula TaxID=85310 RepID=A0A9P0MH54_NEZVI|nr:unnamed protein product [Nezara viridula]
MKRFRQRENRKEKMYNKFENMQGIINDPEQVNDFIEHPKEQYFIERRKTLFFNDSASPNMNQINYFMVNNELPTEDSSFQYSNSIKTSGDYFQSDQRVIFNPKQVNRLEAIEKHDIAERGYSLENTRISTVYFDNPADSHENKLNYFVIKNDLPMEDKSTQYSNTNLKGGEYINEKTELISTHQTRPCSANKEKHICTSALPTYYAEMIPKVNRSRPSSPLAYLHRKENSSYNRLDIIQDNCKHSRSRNLSSEHQMRQETFYDVNYMKNNKVDHSDSKTYINNRIEARPCKIGQTYSTSSQNSNTQKGLPLKKQKHKAIDAMFRGMKSEPESIDKSQFHTNINHAMKYQNSITVFHDQAVTCNNNFPNVHKTHSLSAQSYNIKNKLELRNKRLDTFCETKSEPKPIYNSQKRTNENQAMKHPNSFPTLQKQTSTCNNSFPNALKEYPVQNKKNEKTSKAYYEALNYTQYLIQKLSDKNSQKNIDKEEQINSRMNLIYSGCRSEEKFTQTFKAVPEKKTKNLIYKEKLTQTIK